MKNTKKTVKTPIGEAVLMTRREFEAIADEKFTPSLVVVEDEGIGYYNSYTCLSSYFFGGNCRCISHRPKVWDAFDPSTGKWL
jgi:prepilin signal peptidase PulO-like enzyme (type II secretory pathway)